MDVYLKKRWDLVPNLVESVKGYAEYEKEIFSEITKLRTNSYDAMTTNNKINMNEQLTQEDYMVINQLILNELKAQEEEKK